MGKYFPILTEKSHFITVLGKIQIFPPKCSHDFCQCTTGWQHQQDQVHGKYTLLTSRVARPNESAAKPYIHWEKSWENVPDCFPEYSIFAFTGYTGIDILGLCWGKVTSFQVARGL